MNLVVVCHGELDGLALGVGGLQGLGDCGHLFVFVVGNLVMASSNFADFLSFYIFDLKCESHSSSYSMCL